MTLGWFRRLWEIWKERNVTTYSHSPLICPAPPWLAEDQKLLWSSIVSADRRLLSNPDILLLAVFVSATSTHRKARLKVQELGELITDENGILVVSPWLTIANSQAQIMLRAGKALGFTPRV